MKTKLILAMAGIWLGTYININAQPFYYVHIPTGTTGVGVANSSSNVGIGISAGTPLARLHVVGPGSLFSSLATPTTAALIRGNGNFSTPTNPDYTWYGMGNDETGIYHPSANRIGFSTGGTERMTIGNDNIIVGKPTSNFNTSIGQCANLDFGNTFIGFNVVHNTTGNTWVSQDAGTHANGGSLIWGSVNGQISFAAIPDNSTPGQRNTNDTEVLGFRIMRMRWNITDDRPQVLIGNTMAAAHVDAALSVAGKIVGKEIYVTNSNWADYVFETDYKLMSLDSLNQYINTNNHLPNVPTTEEILTNGNNMGETDRILLEKVEELTLYILQLEKRISELEGAKD